MIDDEVAFEKRMHPNRVCVNYLGKEHEKLTGMTVLCALSTKRENIVCNMWVKNILLIYET